MDGLLLTEEGVSGVGVGGVKVDSVDSQSFERGIGLHLGVVPHISGMQVIIAISKLEQKKSCSRTVVGIEKCDLGAEYID